MWSLGPIGFTAPWLLLGLLALPILWLLLRAVPPAPIRRRFPGVALLLGLTDDDSQSDKTPWWLLLLRMLAIAALIVGFAGPVLNPSQDTSGSGPLLVLVDGTWADASDWPRRSARIDAALSEANRVGRPVAIVQSTDLPAGELPFQAASTWASRLPGLEPLPWQPDPDSLIEWAASLSGAFDTLWVSDGVARPSRALLLQALEARGNVRVFQSADGVLALTPPIYEDGTITVPVLRNVGEFARDLSVVATGFDPNGTPRDLAQSDLSLEAGTLQGEAVFELPPELRNRVTRFFIAGERSAGAVTLTDDSLKRREVALLSGSDAREGLQLLQPLHYLRQALRTSVDLVDAALLDLLLANPDVIIMADIARINPAEGVPLLEWVEQGGLLVRFAGPRLAASDVSRNEEDPLMPVRLRSGGRTVGGAMSWGAPKTLRPFDEASPFFGLATPEEVQVQAQVLAQPGPNLADRTIAALSDGTPLVTRKRIGQGQVVLFHVTANADWSTLPLSGLFVQMMDRLAVSTRSSDLDVAELGGSVWVPEATIDAFGDVRSTDQIAGVPGETLALRQFSASVPPGIYRAEDRRIAMNVVQTGATLETATWPARIPVEGLTELEERQLKGTALGLGVILLAIDVLASLWISGKLRGARVAASLVVALGLSVAMAERGTAQTDPALDEAAIAATSEVVLAYVVTGNAELDAVSAAGLKGLGEKLFRRTSVEPAAPVAVNLETDELSFFPFLYWPITPSQPTPSAEAYANLNRYLRSGGMIMFDTRDADVARFGGSSPEARKLQSLARPLDIPPLEPIPEDHVLTRTFYLLQDFPGRHGSRDVWVEAAPDDVEQVEGIPFRNLNDNVSPVIVGGNDWAGAWAVNDNGLQMFPVGRGYTGERQREVAYRFGINLIMHVLTGNYKSDQVHVPALLDRLGQ